MDSKNIERNIDADFYDDSGISEEIEEKLGRRDCKGGTVNNEDTVTVSYVIHPPFVRGFECDLNGLQDHTRPVIDDWTACLQDDGSLKVDVLWSYDRGVDDDES